ncbi:hypothetical protein [Peristeroidobacter soli]|uniref:hypothetical protein n=1 Tax=Peristeroidobacter soli TaxID=2497877 RepID=UPI00101CC2E3|nr:hypothetical protein [Peristeroidobacter soli]
MNPLDRWTQLIDKTLDLLLANSPTRTGLGVSMGLAVHALMLIFEPALKTLTYLNLTQLPFWSWPVLGIVVMNVRTILSAVRDETVGNEQIDVAIKLIKQAPIPAAVKQQRYAQLIAEVIEGLRFSTEKKHAEPHTD